MTTSQNDKPSNSTPWLPMAGVACIAILAGVFAGSRQSDTHEQDNLGQALIESVQSKLQNTTVLPDDFKTIPAFALPYGDNQMLSEASLKDKWTVLFFGFTNCPDICPNTLNEMNGAVTELTQAGTVAPQVVFITVDPVRDTVEKMAEYVGYFNTDFIGASGELTDITAFASNLGIVASYTADTDGGSGYSVDHTASMLVIDPQLRVRAKLNPPHTRDTMAADLKTLLAHYN